MKIREFQYITPVRNVPSILLHGILSHEAASRLPHDSVAMSEIQDRRDKVRIPGGLMLHQYANLYFHARNPMLYRLKQEAPTLCVLRVSVDGLWTNKAVIADRNASSGYVRFLSINQTEELNLEAIYARDWRHPNDWNAYHLHKSQKCAEFLVPGRVPVDSLTGAYVVSAEAKDLLFATGFNLPIEIDAGLFFH